MNTRAWVATRKGLIELQRGAGGAWRVARTSFLGEPVTMVLPPAPGDPGAPMLAALNLGHFGVKLHASDDAGATWREGAAPAYPPQPDGAPGPAWKLQLVWALQRGSTPRTVWAGTLPGGLFRSDDGGSSWSLNEPLWQQPRRPEWFGGGYDAPGIHSIVTHPQRPDDLLVAISCAGVWHSPDAGRSWALRTQGLRANYMPPEQADDGEAQDPHLVVRCAGEPDKLWCQHHAGIWRSTDDARSWQPVTNAPRSCFGFAVAVHPRHGDTAWFVPGVADQQRVPVGGALVVNRTTDGGASFETFGEGLPQQDCYDLIYRHGLDVAPDGESLLMGSTTGHLWSSDDGGRRWQAVALHLPPIAAVRFG